MEEEVDAPDLYRQDDLSIYFPKDLQGLDTTLFMLPVEPPG